MSYKKLRELKVSHETQTVIKNVDSLIVGEDIFSLALFQILKNENPELEIVFDKEFDLKTLVPQGPGILRGKDNIEYFKKLYPEISLAEVNEESVFFKDQKFRKFSSRSRPEKLLWGEEYFKENRAEFSYDDLFPFLKNEELLREISEKIVIHPLLKIKKEENLFCLYCTDGYILKTKKLYWGRSPHSFFKYYEHKEKLTNEFVQFCEESKGEAALFVNFHFSTCITDRRETLFIPLSYTHDWGHFIGEFDEVTSNGQKAKFVTFFDQGQNSEEDIAKKIRLLKRSLEKIFPEIQFQKTEESIILQGEGINFSINDSLFFSTSKHLSDLILYGPNAPLDLLSIQHEEEGKMPPLSISHLARGLGNLNSLSS